LYSLLPRTMSRLLASVPRLASVVLQFLGVALRHDMSQCVCNKRATGW
jgi:hypothetical protein